VAYSTNMAAALTGATVSQLSHWRSSKTGPLLTPEIQSSPKAIYSFRDILALRTCVRLREYDSLQRIRTAIGNLRDLGDRDHLAAYTIVSDAAGNIQLITHSEALDLTKHPGQQQLFALDIAKVIESFSPRTGVLVPDLFQPRANVAVDPETQGGFPVITGTRVPYDLIAGLVADGIPPEEISQYYPAVSATAARDAIDFARYVNSFDPAKRAA
jgi:uncharacterized protein (DUF433 family)/DNA-binding transcriptional MerR regulator